MPHRPPHLQPPHTEVLHQDAMTLFAKQLLETWQSCLIHPYLDRMNGFTTYQVAEDPSIARGVVTTVPRNTFPLQSISTLAA